MNKSEKPESLWEYLPAGVIIGSLVLFLASSGGRLEKNNQDSFNNNPLNFEKRIGEVTEVQIPSFSNDKYFINVKFEGDEKATNIEFLRCFRGPGRGKPSDLISILDEGDLVSVRISDAYSERRDGELYRNDNTTDLELGGHNYNRRSGKYTFFKVITKSIDN